MKRYWFAVLLGVPVHAGAPPPPLVALNTVEPGQWDFKSRADPSANRLMCVTDPSVLLRLQHRRATCTNFIIANEPRVATVQYSCSDGGGGRTSVRVETARLVQIETQGVATREPFAVTIEGRRIGACGGAADTVRR